MDVFRSIQLSNLMRYCVDLTRPLRFKVGEESIDKSVLVWTLQLLLCRIVTPSKNITTGFSRSSAGTKVVLHKCAHALICDHNFSEVISIIEVERKYKIAQNRKMPA
jgi:hypothetical protein